MPLVILRASALPALTGPMRPGQRDGPLPLTSSFSLLRAVRFSVLCHRGSFPGSAGVCFVGRRLDQRVSVMPRPQDARLLPSVLPCRVLDPGAP